MVEIEQRKETDRPPRGLEKPRPLGAPRGAPLPAGKPPLEPPVISSAAFSKMRHVELPLEKPDEQKSAIARNNHMNAYLDLRL